MTFCKQLAQTQFNWTHSFCHRIDLPEIYFHYTTLLHITYTIYHNHIHLDISKKKIKFILSFFLSFSIVMILCVIWNIYLLFDLGWDFQHILMNTLYTYIYSKFTLLNGNSNGNNNRSVCDCDTHIYSMSAVV